MATTNRNVRAPGSGAVWRDRLTAAAAAATVICLGGCSIGFVGNFSFPDTQCRSFQSWCIVDVPAVGYLGVGASANAGSIDETMISFRLAPRDGVVAAWSSAEIVVVDLHDNRSIPLKALDTNPVTGRGRDPPIEEYLWVLYGPYTQGEVLLRPRIAKMELRFPPVSAGGRMVRVPSVRIHDGTRIPTAVMSLPQ